MEAHAVLTASQRRLYSRHLLLSEIGEAGQAKLCAAEIAVGELGDSGVVDVAVDYLERAGITISEHGSGAKLDAVNAAFAAQFAGDSSLLCAAEALLGAWAAVEAIKTVVGAGTAVHAPNISLTSEKL